MHTSRITRFAIPLSLVLSGFTNQPVVAQTTQELRLLEPSAVQQRREEQGQVYIYDGLYDDTIDRALDTHFDRIEHMMFIGVRHSTEDGEDYADDHC